jgi:hypothetical protein
MVPWAGRDRCSRAGWRQAVMAETGSGGQAKAARGRWKPSASWAAHRQVRSTRSRTWRAERVSWAASTAAHLHAFLAQSPASQTWRPSGTEMHGQPIPVPHAPNLADISSRSVIGPT